jgi:hypothetical protein
MEKAIVVRERCEAIGRNGQRCKHITLRGRLCWQHLKQKEQLRITNSTIPGANLGLFTTKPLVRGEDITRYTGRVVVNADPNYGNAYALQIKKHPPTFIDARRTNEPGLGRWANANLGRGRTNNAQLVYNTRKREANVRATKAIPAKAEITVPYGASYWRHH